MPRIIEGNRMNITGNKVKEFRKERNLSQQELSNQPEMIPPKEFLFRATTGLRS